MRLYLAGPINGCSDSECVDWRERVKLSCHREIEIIDPMSRDYRGYENKNVISIVHGDKEDIHSSHAIIANTNKPSWGTAMEIFWGWSLGIPTHAFMEDPSSASPWIKYHCRTISSSERKALINATKGSSK